MKKTKLNTESQMTLEIIETNAPDDDKSQGTLVFLCCMAVTVIASVNSGFTSPFFSNYAQNQRSISSTKYSIVEGAGDGIYIFGYVFYLIVSELHL